MTSPYQNCTLCPRLCGADREKTHGRCGAPAGPRVAAALLHRWEEPCISGRRGAGTVFFSYCGLGCVFCQNAAISRGGAGVSVSEERLAEVFSLLEGAGAETLDLVTPTHYAPSVFAALRRRRPSVPVVWNTGGYELEERMEELCRYIDVYLPDLKFCSSALSEEMCGAPDYFERALSALLAVTKRLGPPRFSERGILTRGVLVRHLVLPEHKEDSVALLRRLAKETDVKNLRLSLMRQYTPMPDPSLARHRGLSRRLTGLEYGRVAAVAEELGYIGWFQEKGAVGREFIPSFDGTVLGKPL